VKLTKAQDDGPVPLISNPNGRGSNDGDHKGDNADSDGSNVSSYAVNNKGQDPSETRNNEKYQYSE
jgi:hypothetical protein